MPVKRIVAAYPGPVEHITVEDYRMRFDLLAELDKRLVSDRSLARPVVAI
jgi:hypothetical protein